MRPGWVASLILVSLSACSLDTRARCGDGACPEPAQCDFDTGTCVLAPEVARQILIQSPSPGGVLKPQVSLVAMIRERVKLEDGLPPSLPFQITDESGGIVHQGSLSRVDNNTYQGADWIAPKDATYDLSIRGEVRGLFTTTSRFTIDREAPVFQETVPVPPSRTSPSVRVAVIDPNVANPWRRDERLTLVIRSGEPHIDPESVTVSVVGVGGPNGLEGLTEAPLPVTPTSGCGAVYCGAVELDLSKPQLREFRGTFKARITGRDLAGNEGLRFTAIPVTRWKWRQQPAVANSPTQAPLALDSSGAVARVVRAPSGFDELSVTEPSGAIRWAVSRGTFTGGPVVGRRRDGVQPIYLVDNKDAGTLLAYDSVVSKPERALCASAATPPGNSAGALALADLQFGGELAPFESVVGVALSQQDGLNRLFAARLGGSQECILRENVSAMVQGVTMKGTDVLYPSPAGLNQFIVRSHFEAGGWLDVIGFPVGPLRSGLLAVFGDRIFGGGGPRIFGIPNAGGVISWRYPSQDSPFALLDPVITSDSTLLFKSAEGRLLELQVDASAPIASSPILTGTAPGSVPPTLGKGGLIYVPSVEGLDVLRRDLQRDWGYSDPEMIDAAPLLDCSRDDTGTPIPGRPGVAYLAGKTGTLTAAIVDSAGMDGSAPWPRHRHDSRNTGNSTTSLSEFSCP